MLDYESAHRWRDNLPSILLAGALSVFAGGIAICVGHTIVEAFTYTGGENYAKLALFLFGAPALIVQASVAWIAIWIAARPRPVPWARWLQVTIIASAIVPVLGVILLFRRYAHP